MKCDLCHIRVASVHLTEVINDQVTKLHLCEECAKTKGEEMQSHFGLTDLLGSLMEFEPSVSDDEVENELMVKCPSCGMTYHDFQKSGRLGCCKCYEVFRKELGELLRKIHGSDRHVGKMPFMGEKTVEDQKELKRLKTELDHLIKSEEFEKAAIMRDRVRELEEKIGE